MRLLYADDREKAREIPLEEDGSGSFTFQYVAEGSYILQVSSAADAESKDSEAGPWHAKVTNTKANAAVHYADREMPLTVMSDLNDIQVTLATAVQDKAGKQ